MFKKIFVMLLVFVFAAGLAMAQNNTAPAKSNEAGGVKAVPAGETAVAKEVATEVTKEVRATQPETKAKEQSEKGEQIAKKAVKKMGNPYVEIQTNQGTFYLEIFEKETPIHAKNFLDKVKAGKYDGLTFHRIALKQDGTPFVIQGGDPTGTGSGSMGVDRLADETSPFPEVKGTVAMARSSEGASNCQFYVNLSDNTFLDKQKFSSFGKVARGMGVVEKIAKVKRDPNDKPLEPVVMTKLTVLDKLPSEAAKSAPAGQKDTEKK